MIGAIILAAGSSSRMGQSKQMLPVHGQPLLTNAVKAVLDSGISRVVVVLGANEKAHRDILSQEKVNITLNTDWELGMGNSIRAGLHSILSTYPDLSGVVILVCDQPLLTSEIISGIIERYHETAKPVIASFYQGTSGVPVFFSQAYFEKLRNLPDDQGAKKLILQNLSDVALFPFPGGEIDLDTMDDYNAFVGPRQSTG
jgi:molybdenum cofactor cytidylyltransferase